MVLDSKKVVGAIRLRRRTRKKLRQVVPVLVGAFLVSTIILAGLYAMAG